LLNFLDMNILLEHISAKKKKFQEKVGQNFFSQDQDVFKGRIRVRKTGLFFIKQLPLGSLHRLKPYKKWLRISRIKIVDFNTVDFGKY
jgi:hypothetical protein